MNEMTNYIFRHMRIVESSIGRLRKEQRDLNTISVLLFASCVITFTLVCIQDKQIEDLQKEVLDLKEKGE